MLGTILALADPDVAGSVLAFKSGFLGVMIGMMVALMRRSLL